MGIYVKKKNSTVLYQLFQTNWASTRTDTSRSPTRWTPHSPNWQDIKLLCPFMLPILITMSCVGMELKCFA